MGYSQLCSSIVPAVADNYTQGRAGYKICKFTPHHMAGVLTGEQCARLFQNSGRNASANYCIGNDGRIVGCVDEDNRAWTSSSKSNDCQAITVEVSNCATGGEWPISEAAWKSLVNLAVDICQRYNFRLTYDGTPNASLTRHNMFAATSCPGPYLQNKFNDLVKEVNERLDGGKAPEVKPVPAPTTKYQVGETVTINGIYTSSNSTTKLNPLRNSGKITRIVAGAHNPYLLDNGNLGWTNDGCIVENKPAVEPTPAKKSVNEIAKEVIAGQWGNGQDRKNRLEAAGYNYNEVQAEVNRIVNGGNTPAPAPTNTDIRKGDRVKVTKAVDYNGTKLSSSVLNNTYDVIEVSGNRVVIGKGKAVTAAMNKANLKKV